MKGKNKPGPKPKQADELKVPSGISLEPWIHARLQKEKNKGKRTKNNIIETSLVGFNNWKAPKK